MTGFRLLNSRFVRRESDGLEVELLANEVRYKLGADEFLFFSERVLGEDGAPQGRWVDLSKLDQSKRVEIERNLRESSEALRTHFEFD